MIRHLRALGLVRACLLLSALCALSWPVLIAIDLACALREWVSP